MKYCTYCGKAIADEAVICLNCGCQTKNPKGNSTFQTTVNSDHIIHNETESSVATWSKICGITSFFFGWFALGITAIVLAYLSKEETNGIMCSSAKVGCVCGIISTIVTFIAFVVIVAVLVSLSI